MNVKHLFFFLVNLFNCSCMYAQDWPNLQRFREANSKLEIPRTDQPRVVFMGNSITEGWSDHHPEFFEGKPYVNRGIGGQTTPQMLLRFRQDVIDLKPVVVVILAGINDIAENTGPSTVKMIIDNIKSMAELAESNDIKVVICSVLPANNFPWRPRIIPTEKVVELNNYLQSYSQLKGHVYADYYSEMVNHKRGLKEELGYDPVHPNREGYLVMEPILEQAIKLSLDR